MHTDAVTGKALTASAKGGNMFKIHSDYKPTGDQPKAIAEVVEALPITTSVCKMQSILFSIERRVRDV